MKDTINPEIDFLRIELPFIIKEIIERQYTLQPEFSKYGIIGMEHSLNDAKYNLEYLFSAIEVDSKLLFLQYNRWAYRLFENLKLPLDTLDKFYSCTREVFKERFDKGQISKELFLKLIEYIDAGTLTLSSEEHEPSSYFKKDNPLKEYLHKYSEFVFSGDRNSATKLIGNISRRDIEIKDIYKYILQPFQLELGKLWYESKISVAQEHYATAVSQNAMSMLYERIFSTPKNEKVFLGTCVQGELHEFGMRMISDYMESCGWNTYYLGANMPDKGIIQMIREKSPDIIAISCTMTFNISKIQNLITAIKSSSIDTPVIVGGFPFNSDKTLWKKIGADACSSDFEEVYSISEILCGGGKNEIL